MGGTLNPKEGEGLWVRVSNGIEPVIRSGGIASVNLPELGWVQELLRGLKPWSGLFKYKEVLYKTYFQELVQLYIELKLIN